MGSRRRQNRQNSNSVVDFDVDARGTSTRMFNSGRNEQSVKFNFADFENILRKFLGDETISIKKWLAEFEQYASTFCWNELQKFIFCKRSLTGAAKFFTDCDARALTYHELRNALIEEFQPKLTSADVHNKLKERKKRSDETLREYLYHMIDIGSQADVDDQSIIEYVVEGIKDYASNKSVLYGAKTIKEFKEKLEVYEKIRKENDKRSNLKSNDGDRRVKKATTGKNDKPKSKRFCFNCGSSEHEFHSCPQKEKGPKCFGCNKYGHKKTDCPESNAASKSSHVIVKSGMYVPCKINDYTLESLVDTGSDICVIKECCVPVIHPECYCKTSRLSVAGLGANVITKGSCIVKIEIEGETFENVEVHVVDSSFMKPDMLIGMSLLQFAVVNIEAGKVKISKNKSESTEAKTEESTKTCFLSDFAVETDDKMQSDFPDMSHLKEKHIKEKVLALIENYLPEAPPTSPIQMKIVTTDDIPIYRPPRRFPPKEQRIIEEQIKEWLEKGIIRESCSDYASQVVLVKKKDGSHRLCVDYRNINKKIHKDRYPLPNIEDQVDKLQGSKYFTTLDLENGFFHVVVEEQSRKFTSFVASNGQYEFTRVPFGLCNSPSVFQKYINYILRDLINEGTVIIYLDDIVIPSMTIEEGLDRLQRVLQVAATNGLKIKWRKCQILQDEIEYLGYHVSNGHISPSTAKTKAVLNFPTPTTVRQLQSFMGLASYFRKFIRNFAIIARPLSDLLKKGNEFKLEEKELAAIKEIKNILATKPVLKIFEYGVDTELHTDASKEGYGAILLQKDNDNDALHPVHFMSKKTTDSEKRYCSYELEVLAVVEAVKRFRVYLLGQPFKLVTDCKAFECTLKKKDLATRVARWALLLEEFQYTVEHRDGNQMRHVDALSRNPISMCVNNDNESFLKKLREAQQKDERIRAIWEILKTKSFQDYIIHNNILCKNINNTLLFVVPDSMAPGIIRNAHEKGHFHTKKMKEILEKEYFIQNLQKRIEAHVRGCIKCILAEKKKGKAECYLQPIPKGDQPLQTFHVDHLGPMQNTKKNYRYIFAIIDGFTKYCWLFPTKTLNSEEVIQKLEDVAETFGYPERILADHGGAFISNSFKEYCEERNIRLIHATVGIPRGNGQVERLHSTVIAALTKLSADEPEKWYRFVKPLQHVLNSTYQRAIQTTPFHVLVGQEMRTKQNVSIMKIIEEEWMKQFQDKRQEIREQAKKDIAAMQAENKRYYDKKRKEARKYNVGDLVAIERVQFGTGLKIRPKFLGPYRVTTTKAFDRYQVKKEGNHEGPNATECSADKMKYWPEGEVDEFEDEDSTEEDEISTRGDDANIISRDTSYDEGTVPSGSDGLSGEAECGK